MKLFLRQMQAINTATVKAKNRRQEVFRDPDRKIVATKLIRSIVQGLPLVWMLLLPNLASAEQIPTTPNGTWTVSGKTATKTTPGGLTMTVTLTGAGMTFGAIGNTASLTGKNVTTPALPSATNGIQIVATSQPSCVASSLTCTGYGTISFSFKDPTGTLVKVKNPVLHVSRLGGLLTSGNKTALHGSIMDLTTAGVTLGAPSTGSRAFLTTPTQLKTDLSVFPTLAASGSAMGDCIAVPGAPQAGCGSIPIIGTTSSLDFIESMYRRDVTVNGLPKWIDGSVTAADGIYFTMSFDEDFGDAPKTYDANNAASHIISDLTLGSTITTDNPTTFNGGATGTTGLVATSPKAVGPGVNNNGANGDGASDDGVTSFPPLRTDNTTYALPVNLSGASRAGKVCGWIDTNKNGTFENTAAERICTDFIAGATTANLNWAGLSGLTVGNTYVRIRATYDISATVLTATGRLSSGEVEDYQLQIVGIPDLTITKTASATTFNRGQKGATFTLNVKNIGNGATSGTVTVTDTLPVGTAAGFLNIPPLVPPAFTPTAATGDGWNCVIGTAPNATTPAPISCTNTNVLAAGASYPPITLTVDVNTNGSVPSPRTNNAAVSGGGETNVANDTSSVSVALATSNTPDLAISKTHTGNFTPGQTGTYTLTAKNLGPGATTTAAVTVVDTLPTGLTYNNATGTGWTCTPNSPAAGQISCTRTGSVLAAGLSHPPITVTVNVAANAPQSVTNSATVSGGGQTAGTNDTATDPTTIVAADLTIAKTHTGNFSQQQKGAVYTLTATNSGNLPTTGTVTVTDALPMGLTATAISGAGWTCDLPTLTCTRTDSAPAGTNYPPITITVDVAANASTPLVNSAGVSGGGETNITNNGASDSTVVNVVSTPPVTVSGTLWDDANNSANNSFANIFTAGESGTSAGGLYAILVDAAGNTVASTPIAADGTYTFTNVLANQNNLKLRLTTLMGVFGEPAPDPEIFADWVATSPIETATFTIGTSNITNQDFGLEQLPNTFDVFATDAILNPNGTNQTVVPTLSGADPENGSLGAGNSFAILTLPTNGILYYAGTVVLPGQVITNYDPALLKVDPNNGAVSIDFTYAAIDAAGKQSVNPGAVSMLFSVNPSDFKIVKRITAINGISTINPSDNLTPLDQVLNNTDTANDDDPNWKAGYLVGAFNGGKIKPGDIVEYTVYFLNAKGANAKTIQLCDRIINKQTYQFGSMELRLGAATTSIALTDAIDTGTDRGAFYATSSSAPGTCNLVPLGSNTDNGTVVVDITGTGSTVQPTLTTVPSATAPGVPTTSYGFIRFKTKVNP